jgi:hypothetical protein
MTARAHFGDHHRPFFRQERAHDRNSLRAQHGGIIKLVYGDALSDDP